MVLVSDHTWGTQVLSRYPGFSGSDSGAVGISESSIGTIPLSECGDYLDKMIICTLHSISRSKCECKMLVEGNVFLFYLYNVLSYR